MAVNRRGDERTPGGSWQADYYDKKNLAFEQNEAKITKKLCCLVFFLFKSFAASNRRCNSPPVGLSRRASISAGPVVEAVCPVQESRAQCVSVCMYKNEFPASSGLSDGSPVVERRAARRADDHGFQSQGRHHERYDRGGRQRIHDRHDPNSFLARRAFPPSSFTNDDAHLEARVPVGATSGALSIQRDNGTIFPSSQSFTITSHAP